MSAAVDLIILPSLLRHISHIFICWQILKQRPRTQTPLFGSSDAKCLRALFSMDRPTKSGSLGWGPRVFAASARPAPGGKNGSPKRRCPSFRRGRCLLQAATRAFESLQAQSRRSCCCCLGSVMISGAPGGGTARQILGAALELLLPPLLQTSGTTACAVQRRPRQPRAGECQRLRLGASMVADRDEVRIGADGWSCRVDTLVSLVTPEYGIHAGHTISRREAAAARKDAQLV